LISSLIVCTLLLLQPLAIEATMTTVHPGVSYQPPSGYASYNVDPTLTNATENGLVFDPNFIPGFQIGLPNTSISWSTGAGYGKIGYSVGPWDHMYRQVPHLAVGPQNSNFKEVSRTQQFRLPSWGDYYYVKAGFIAPGVNMPNYNASFALKEPIYVGLRNDWEWVVQFSLDWTPPVLMNSKNEWAAVGLVATEYVPSAPTKLIYTEVDFWMDTNSSTFANSTTVGSAEGFDLVRFGPTSATYHPKQLSTIGNVTVSVNLTRYCEETLRLLGFPDSPNPPVISYTFLNVEGYNMRWNGTLYSFFDMSNNRLNKMGSSVLPSTAVFLAAIIIVSAVGLSFVVFGRRRRRPTSVERSTIRRQ
jgi:hypothetical protein